jgi:hypothetical protein
MLVEWFALFNMLNLNHIPTRRQPAKANMITIEYVVRFIRRRYLNGHVFRFEGADEV